MSTTLEGAAEIHGRPVPAHEGTGTAVDRISQQYRSAKQGQHRVLRERKECVSSIGAKSSTTKQFATMLVRLPVPYETPFGKLTSCTDDPPTFYLSPKVSSSSPVHNTPAASNHVELLAKEDEEEELLHHLHGHRFAPYQCASFSWGNEPQKQNGIINMNNGSVGLSGS
jgi:hypothetical protein